MLQPHEKMIIFVVDFYCWYDINFLVTVDILYCTGRRRADQKKRQLRSIETKQQQTPAQCTSKSNTEETGGLLCEYRSAFRLLLGCLRSQSVDSISRAGPKEYRLRKKGVSGNHVGKSPFLVT